MSLCAIGSHNLAHLGCIFSRRTSLTCRRWVRRGTRCRGQIAGGAIVWTAAVSIVSPAVLIYMYEWHNSTFRGINQVIIKKLSKALSVAAALFALSTAAQATIFSLSQPVIQQSVITANTASGVGATTGTGIWTWDDVTNTVRQTGHNTLTFGPALPGSVGYFLNITGMVITVAGATTATAT